ncbi:MAG: AraC family transcriptional regulator [Pseudobdellovibrionaceae bacterium]|nr:MAG: AraC family transcriptional regulator [Pseudobdellovibrionaceae bacterium]
MLADPASFQTSILDVGLSVGYNSKSTFNAAFRRIVGETPSAFRKANAHGQ